MQAQVEKRALQPSTPATVLTTAPKRKIPKKPGATSQFGIRQVAPNIIAGDKYPSGPSTTKEERQHATSLLQTTVALSGATDQLPEWKQLLDMVKSELLHPNTSVQRALTTKRVLSDMWAIRNPVGSEHGKSSFGKAIGTYIKSHKGFAGKGYENLRNAADKLGPDPSVDWEHNERLAHSLLMQHHPKGSSAELNKYLDIAKIRGTISLDEEKDLVRKSFRKSKAGKRTALEKSFNAVKSYYRIKNRLGLKSKKKTTKARRTPPPPNQQVLALEKAKKDRARAKKEARLLEEATAAAAPLLRPMLHRQEATPNAVQLVIGDDTDTDSDPPPADVDTDDDAPIAEPEFLEPAADVDADLMPESLRDHLRKHLVPGDMDYREFARHIHGYHVQKKYIHKDHPELHHHHYHSEVLKQKPKETNINASYNFRRLARGWFNHVSTKGSVIPKQGDPHPVHIVSQGMTPTTSWQRA